MLSTAAKSLGPCLHLLSAESAKEEWMDGCGLSGHMEHISGERVHELGGGIRALGHAWYGFWSALELLLLFA